MLEKGRSLIITMFEAKPWDTVCEVPRSIVHKMLQTVVWWSLGALHKVPRSLLWSGQCWL